MMKLNSETCQIYRDFPTCPLFNNFGGFNPDF